MRGAGVPNQSATKEMEPTRVVHPRTFILAQFDAVCYKGVATKYEDGSTSRQIDSFGPSCAVLCSGAAAQPTTRLESSAGRCDRVCRGSDPVGLDSLPVIALLWGAGDRVTQRPGSSQGDTRRRGGRARRNRVSTLTVRGFGGLRATTKAKARK